MYDGCKLYKHHENIGVESFNIKYNIILCHQCTVLVPVANTSENIHSLRPSALSLSWKIL